MNIKDVIIYSLYVAFIKNYPFICLTNNTNRTNNDTI